MRFAVAAAVLTWMSPFAIAAEALLDLSADPYRLFRDADDLTPLEVANLEWQVTSDRRDLDARFKLAFYHWHRQWEDPKAKEKFAEHYIWFVANAPASKAFDLGGFDLGETEPRFAEARDLWRQQAIQYADNARVQSYAGAFLLHAEPDEALRLLERARALDPENPDRYDDLAQWHHLQLSHAPAADVRRLAAEQLRLLKRAQELSGEGLMSSRVDLMAEAALKAGETAEARRLAQVMIDQPGDDWNRGNRIHVGHQVLGTTRSTRAISMPPPST